MAKYDPYATGLSIGQMLAHAKGREDKHSIGFARTGQPAPSPDQELMAAIEAQIFGTPFNNVGAPQRDPAVGRPMRATLRSDADYADGVRAVRQRRYVDNNNDGSLEFDAQITEANRLEDLLPEDPNPDLGGAPVGEKEAYAYFDRRAAAAPKIDATAVMPLIAAQQRAAQQPQSRGPSRSFISATRSSGRGGSPYFEAGPSSQAGLDMASALLQQRLGAMGQNQSMDLMYRRDPRAATALIQSQIAAQEEAANRAQRGDIAGQEMDYRNRSLDMQGQMAGADRQASMERLLASLAGQRGLAGEQMSHAERLQQAAQIAATQEASAQREFQRGQTDSQQKFQGTLADKQMKHSTESESRRAMLETMLKGMEISGLDKRSQDDMRTKMMAAYANLAESASDPGYPAAKAELDKVFANMNAQMSGAPAPIAATKPAEPPTAEGRFMQKYPEVAGYLKMKSLGKDGQTKRAMRDFLYDMPIEDIANNAPAIREFLKLNYQNVDPRDELVGGMFWGPSSIKKLDEIKSALGIKETPFMGVREQEW